MAKRIGGPIYIRIDGQLVYTRSDFIYNPGADKAETIVGTDRVHSYTEKPEPAMAKFTISKMDDVDVAKLKRSRNSTISAPLPGGKTFTLPNAWCVSSMEVNATTGEVELQFEGATSTEA